MGANEGATVSVGHVAAGRVLIVGRSGGSRRHGDRWHTVVTMPAPDAYSMPSVVSVTSAQRLAGPDEDVKVLCRVGGRPESWKDRESGEIVKSARIWLEAVSG